MLLTVSIIGLFAVLLFTFLFLKVLSIDKFSNENIRNKAYPQMMEINKTIISLSSASIALTVSFLKSDDNNLFLYLSWVALSCSIIFSMFIFFIKYSCDISINTASENSEGTEINPEGNITKLNTKAIKAIKTYLILRNFLLTLSFLQMLSFISGFIMLIIFAVT